MKLLEGISNKVGFLCVFLSACFWVVYIVGFVLQYQWQYEPAVNNSSATDTLQSLPYFACWSYMISSLPLYLAVLVQFLCGNTFFSLIVAGFLPLVLVSVGGVLQINGLLYYYYYVDKSSSSPPADFIHVQVAGALGALILLWVSLLLWVCGSQRSKSRRDYQQIN